jgi:pimeloyl-ACP methyl ester carboxylesterase
MATFVLVHGGWHGAWCWRRVSRLLAAQGHEVFTPTLTGLGERSHLLRPEINLETHIADVVNVVKWNELNDVVLVGHSYGGIVTSGAIEDLTKSISSYIMLDAWYAESGQSMFDIQLPEVREGISKLESSGSHVVPIKLAASINVNEKDRAWVDSLLTPQPIRTFTQKLKSASAREHVEKKSYIRAAGFPHPMFDKALATAEAKKWRTCSVPCGHDVMIDMPERLAGILNELA